MNLELLLAVFFLARVGIGDVVQIAMESWAGRTYHAARIEKMCPKRARVFWLDHSQRHGTSSYVPKTAIVLAEGRRS